MAPTNYFTSLASIPARTIAPSISDLAPLAVLPPIEKMADALEDFHNGGASS
jgi:hypothetical protein